MPDVQIFDDMSACTEEAVQQLLPLVSEWRRAVALKFRHTFGQFACLKSFRMLQEMTGINDIVFEYNQGGKPSIAGHPEIFFNISHCREAIAVAVSSSPVGIDIESLREADASLIRYTMNEEEAAAITSGADPKLEFIKYWTRKEAVLKLRGTGITDSLHTVLSGPELTETHICDRYVWSLSQYPL